MQASVLPHPTIALRGRARSAVIQAMDIFQQRELEIW
jgi:hypothetical protein